MPETILITGGAGTLGRAVTKVLLARGDHVRILDLVAGDSRDGVEWLVGDLRRPEDVARAVQGTDAIIHAAAWHGMHLADHSAADFWDLNVDGTFHVFEAAVAASATRAVVASTMGVYGASRAPGPNGGATRLHEDLPLKPINVYELSKVLTEQIAASYDLRAEHGVRSIALRFGMFVPQPFGHSGIRFLYGGADDRDVASAVVTALDRTRNADAGNFAAYNVFSPLPFGDADAAQLTSDPMAVVARHWPDAAALLQRAGTPLWGPIREWYDVSRARNELGWKPRYGFEEFLAALREGRSEL